MVVFQLDISGKDNNDSHPKNKDLIVVTVLVVHLDISGKDDNNLQS